jgi:predicted permease
MNPGSSSQYGNEMKMKIHPSLRALLRSPMFTLVAVVTLAIGIGANTAIFSVVNGVLLKPLHFEDPERLVAVWHTAPGLNFEQVPQSPAFHFTYRDETRALDSISLWGHSAVSVTGLDDPERVDVIRWTQGMLPLLGTRPVLGRSFSAEDCTPGSPQTVILSFAYWQRKFGGDPDVLGRTLEVNGTSREIIGVTPRTFRFLNRDSSLFLPYRFDLNEVIVGNFSYQSIARLNPGVTLEGANADLARMLPLAFERFPLPPGLTREMLEEAGLAPTLIPLKQDVVGDVSGVLWVLLGTVGLVLLIACANVANLFLVRAEGRQQEFAVRTALGADWGRLTRGLLLESLILAILGGLCGLILAVGGIRLLTVMGPENLPRLDEIGIDPTVLLFTLGISLIAGLLFGIIPVLKYARPQIVNALKEGGRTFSDGRNRHRARNGLVVSQVALALVLLIGSGLMIRSFQALRNVSPGFENPRDVLTLRIFIPASEIEGTEDAVRGHHQIADRLQQLAGVESVGLSTSITMDGANSADPLFIEEFPTPEGQIPPIRRYKWVGPNYFETMGNPLVAGRSLTWNDIFAKTPVVIVTENLAREYWPDPGMALGKRVRPVPDQPWREIIGVVGDVHDDGASQEATPVVYWPMLIANFWDSELWGARTMNYAIRSPRVGTAGFMAEIRETIWGFNRNLPLANVRTLGEIYSQSMARTSFTLVMLGIAAGVALLLGMVGIYGVVSYVVSQRTREIGIRMAVGAQQKDMIGMFLRHGILLTCAGLVIGWGAAFGLTRLMSSLLFGVSAMDPVTYGAVALILGSIALLASFIPAFRASRVDPVDALRWE